MKDTKLQGGGEPAPDALDRELGRARKKHGPQAATNGGALAGDSLSRTNSITPAAGQKGSGSSADTTAQIQGGDDAQMPSAVSTGTPAAVARAPELNPKGMPPRAGGPITTGTSRPALAAQNDKRSGDRSVMGGRFSRIGR
jgi:hypothetical protein